MVIVCATFFSNCSIKDDYIDSREIEKINYPAHIEEYGKTFAAELRQTINNLNEQGVNYSQAKNTPEFKERFYKDWYSASPALTRSNVSIDQIGISPEKFAEGYRNLTAIQIEFIQRIIQEGEKVSSYEKLFKVLKNINNDIYAQVPKIEQERLLYTTAVLYYGLSEIQNLEKQGQMLLTPNSNLHSPLVKTRSESGGDVGGWCRKFLAATWAFAIGEPTPAGEIVASIATVITVGGILLYEIIVCKNGSGGDTDDYCQQKFASCYSPIPNGCGICLQFCLVQRYWPPVSTHQCY